MADDPPATSYKRVSRYLCSQLRQIEFAECIDLAAEVNKRWHHARLLALRLQCFFASPGLAFSSARRYASKSAQMCCTLFRSKALTSGSSLFEE
jgi:hypothetical protein